MEDTLLTAEEVERRFGIPEKTLANWRCQRKGPAYYKLGGKVKYAEKDIDTWRRNCRVLTADCKE